MTNQPSVLARIVASKQIEVAQLKAAADHAEWVRRAAAGPPVRDFLTAVGNAARGPIRLIAEVKKASPSKGVIRADFDPVGIARLYERHGAACISVLTDEPFFQGHLDYLRQIRAAVNLPLLRKDFIVDAVQVYEARAAGADAVLLIAECLDDPTLRQLHHLIVACGMTPLVELYDPANLPRVLAAGAALVGVNNRNLHTFEVDLGHTMRMRREIPSDRLVVGESGIESFDDAQRLAQAGVQAMLVGESLVRQADIGRAVDRLLGNGVQP